MTDIKKFKDFLKNEKIYQQNVELYDALLHKITNETITGWVTTKFANGTSMFDGNPIYSAFIETKKIAIRIIQIKHDTSKPVFNVWINNDPFEIKGLAELVISLQLRQDTYEDLSCLLEKFVNQTLSRHVIEFLNDKYKDKAVLNNSKKAESYTREEVVSAVENIALAPTRKALPKKAARTQFN
jgi:hypothetical protein